MSDDRVPLWIRQAAYHRAHENDVRSIKRARRRRRVERWLWRHYWTAVLVGGAGIMALGYFAAEGILRAFGL